MPASQGCESREECTLGRTLGRTLRLQNHLKLKVPLEGVPPDPHSKDITKLLEPETQYRGRSEALCYEYIQSMVIYHSRTELDTLTMSIKFTMGSDISPNP